MRKISAIFKLLFLSIWSIICVFTAFLVFVLTFFNRKVTLTIAHRIWAPFTLFIMGVKVKVEGVNNFYSDKPYVIIANHSSYLDVPLLMKVFPKNVFFIGKEKLKKIPLIGWYLRLSGMIFIDREDHKKAKESINKAVCIVKGGHSVLIFPEGTTSVTGEIAAFKKGAFILAKEADAAILPIHIIGSNIAWPRKKMLNLRNYTVIIKIGKLIPLKEFKEKKLTVNMKEFKKILENL